MYRIALCDDNLEYLELIKNRIREYCMVNRIEAKLDCFIDSSHLDELIDEKQMYDAYILDIEMPFVSGVDLAERIREKSEDVPIVFLTAYDSYAIKACNILHKSLNDPELYLAERSLIININHIKRIVESRIYMTDGYELVIGKNNLADLKQYLNQYWSSLT